MKDHDKKHFPSMEIDISAYKNTLILDIENLDSLTDLQINVGRIIPIALVKKGFKETNEFLREFNKDNPNYRFSEDHINLDDTNIPYQIGIKWVYSNDELELLTELSDEIKKLFNLKRTDVIIDPNVQSYCEISKDIIKCYVESEEDMIHELTHAFFRERNAILREQLEEEQYRSKIKDVVPDKYLEEITSRIVSYNIQHKYIRKCDEGIQKFLMRTYKQNTEKLGDIHYSIGYEYDTNLEKHIDIELGKYKNIEIVKKVFRLYGALYDYYCICPKDYEFYKSIKNDVDPLMLYNKLARYIGIHELKDK